MLYIGHRDIPDSDEHEGFVAGRYRNSAYSDVWTDVRRCAPGTFTAYAAACECGWRGVDRPLTGPGFDTCRTDWVHAHFATHTGTDPAVLHPADFLTS